MCVPRRAPHVLPRLSCLVLLTSFAGLAAAQGLQSAKDAAKSLPPVVHLTSEQAHQRMMRLLHITSLRPGANGMDPKAPNYANYDESKANPYPNLPDPLRLNDGKKVTTAKQWWEKRRPQIEEDFDRDVYGVEPKETPSVNWEVTKTTDEKVGDVPVITKELVGHVDNSPYPLITVNIKASLTAPAHAKGPVPVIIEFGIDPAFLAQMRARMEARGVKFPPSFPGPTWQEQLVAKGWGYAVLVPTTVQADNGAGLTEGIIGLCNKGQPRKLDDWGALRAWAWGASRLLDYFETDPGVDAKQVGITGHSRYGKAALVTMAYDQRFAIAYISSSGKGGAALYRRDWGEKVANVAATSEYHWMAGNFLKYAGPLTAKDMPVDTHELIAMCAPRPVFLSAGSLEKGDGWVDAKGTFMAGAAAGPVYELLGKKGLGTTVFPPIETPLIGGDIAFRQHSEGHTPAPNWPTFIEFASRYLHVSPGSARAKTSSP
jgi:hypothetical protein